MKNSAFNTEVYASIARKTQAEGVVMLENRDGALPLPAGTRVALFGRSQFQYYKSGTGSGGMVNTAYPGSRRRWRSPGSWRRAPRRRRRPPS